ncbi:hypothetical protein J2X90_000714 [Variovorax paradoxus]|uniref:hypothetical protein n=1 Tax=Variovorax paradoxus TaxID=34073 RepID=UPI002782C512|nr:hypothetical protein [Variovorax paradoxus]MDQ0022928.1 hypothetical protein [Variovorax paradoxus]
MLNPVVVNVNDFRKAQPQADEGVVNNVFKVLHGYYGNLFLSKFASGVTDAAGRDKGVASARSVWAHKLRMFDEATVVTALEHCQGRHPEYPPSLPQFVALCAAAMPREVYQQTNAIGMSDELRSRYARQARAINEKHAERARNRVTGYKPLPPGLDGLKQSIANAIGCAGGDEAGALLNLDRLFVTGAAHE